MLLWMNHLPQNVNKTQNTVEIEPAHLLFVHNLCVDLPLQLVVSADTHKCTVGIKMSGKNSQCPKEKLQKVRRTISQDFFKKLQETVAHLK